MTRSLAMYIALRYVSVGKRSQLVSFMSLLTICGLALSIAILITVLSVMNGFDRELRENILNVLPHATVKNPDRISGERWQDLQRQLEQYPGVIDTAPLIEATGVIATSQGSKGLLINGIDLEQPAQMQVLQRFMRQGDIQALRQGRFNIVLGETLARQLGVGVGDRVSVYSLNISINPVAPMPTQRQFTVVGIYRVGSLELDSALGIISLQDAQALYRLGNTYSGVRIQTEDMLAVNVLATRLRNELPFGFRVDTWTQLFGNIYENIRLSRTIVGFLLWLLVAVAAFNLVVSLIMIVRDKRGDIAILRTLGARPGTVGRVFMLQGCMIGLLGLGLGIAAGVALSLGIGDLVAMIESLMGRQLLSAEVYPVDFLPSQLRWRDVFLVSAGVLLLCLLASVYPAWRATRVQPAAALRME